MESRHKNNGSPTITPLSANGQIEHQEAIQQPKFLPNWDDAHMCNSPGDATHFLKRGKRKQNDKTSRTLRSWIVDNQIGLSVNLLALLALTHLSFPRFRRRTSSFFQLSYHHPDTNLYHQGPEDFFYVATWIVIFTGLRAAVMTHLLIPAAGLAGLKKPKTQVRFAEQAWLLLYYVVFWSIGMYIFMTSKYWLNFRELWTDFPARYMTATMKWYYLAQFAFWIQQIVVVNIEDRRKDHWQMFTHHIVTCILILTSLGYNQMRVGNVILCIMDVVDLVFPVAKMLRYTGHQFACDIAFGVFMLTWFIARHIIYMFVVYSVYAHSTEVMTYGVYSTATGAYISKYPNDKILSNILQPFIDPEGPVSYHPNMKYAFLFPLLFLQGITIMWFAMIVKIAWNVVRGGGAGDTRSEDEDEAEEVEELDDYDTKVQDGTGQKAVDAALQEAHAVAEPISMQPIEIDEPPQEQYVGVESLNLKRRGGSPRYANKGRMSGTATGLAFTGHSDRKELLGRIGCDKPS